ncbi:MAG: hypothetical protein Q9M28_07845, partial [Mariprofundaceae bacterium]|nr:hypothetical protein [Mariprofundaceae bacterium]
TANVVVDVYSTNLQEIITSPTQAQLTFTPIDWDKPQNVAIAGVDDPYTDGPQSVDLYAQVNTASGGYSVMDFYTVAVTNTDNDVAGVSMTLPTNNTDETGLTSTVNVTLTTPPAVGTTVVVDVYSMNSAEVTTAPAQLSFTSDTYSVVQTVTLTGVDDPYADGNQNVDIYARVNADMGGYLTTDFYSVVATNNDNEVAGITTTTISNNTSEGGATASFAAVLDSQPMASVVLDIYSGNTSEVQVDAGYSQITFTQANWNIAQTVPVYGVDDPYTDGLQSTNIYANVNTSIGGYNTNILVAIAVSNTDNDVAGIIMDPPVSNTTENLSGTTTVDVRLAVPPIVGTTVLVDVYSMNSAEISVTSQLSFTSDTYAVAQTVTLTGVDDPYTDGDQNVDIYARVNADMGGYLTTDFYSVVVTNIDNDVAGVSMTLPTRNTTEAGITSTVNVTLTTAPVVGTTVLVDVYSMNSAEVSVASQLSFTSDTYAIAQTVTLTGVDDPYTDGDQNVDIYARVNADMGGYLTTDFYSVVATNTDNDVAGVSMTLPTNNTDETGLTSTVNVTLTTAPAVGTTVVIDVYSMNSAEVSTPAAQLSFTSDTYAVAQTVTLTGVDDPYTDGNQNVDIYARVNADMGGYLTTDFYSVVVTNIDNDVAGVSMTLPTNNTSEAGLTSTVNVTLTTAPAVGTTVVVDVYSMNSAEITALPAQLSFTSDTYSVVQMVTLTGVDDPYTDGDQNVDIYARVNADMGGYLTTDFYSVVVTNIDNDVASITTTAASNNTSEAGTTATFTVVLDAQPTASVVVDIYSMTTTEVQIDAGYSQLTFSQANWNAPQTVQVIGIDDPYTDGLQMVNVYAHVNPASGGYNDNYSVAVVSNDDNEVAGITTSAASGNTNESGTSATFSVSLAAQPTGTVLVDIYSMTTTEVQVDAAYTQLTFSTGNWGTPQTVQVTGVNDAIFDGSQMVNIYAHVNAASVAFFADVYSIVVVTNVEDDLEGGTGDGMPDDWETANGLSTAVDDSGLTIARDPYTGATTASAANFDLDKDGLINQHEYLCGTNPNGGFVDTDIDGFSDDFETCLAQTGWTSSGVAVADNRETDSDADGFANFDEYIDYRLVNSNTDKPYILQTRQGQAMIAANFVYVPGGWDLNNDGTPEPGFWIAKYEAKTAIGLANDTYTVSQLLQAGQVFNPTAGTQRFSDRLCDNANQDPAANIGLALDAYTSDLTGACRGNQYVATTMAALGLAVNKVNFTPTGVPLVSESWIEARAALISSPVTAASVISGLGATLTNPDNTATLSIDLPSESQHMQLVQLIVNNTQDWSGNVLNTNGVFRGNSNGTAASAAVAGTGINTRTHTIANGTTVFGYSSIGVQAAIVLNDPAVPAAYSAVVYDLAGNVYEWTLGLIAANINTGAVAGGDRFVSGNSNWVEYTAVTGTMPTWWKPVLSTVTTLNSTGDVGKYNDGIQLVGATGAADNIAIGYTPLSPTGITSGFAAVARGGRWDDGTSAGISAASLVYGPGYQDAGIGFRASAP